MAEFNAVFRLQGIANQEPREINVTPNGLSIGRSGDNDLPLPHSQISRQHARLFFRDDHYWIEDLNSSNGAWVNDARIRPSVPQVLRVGDVIRMGPFVLTYLRDLTPAPPLPVEPMLRADLPELSPPSTETPVIPALPPADQPGGVVEVIADAVKEVMTDAIRDALGVPAAPEAPKVGGERGDESAYDTNGAGIGGNGSRPHSIPPSPPGGANRSLEPDSYPVGIPRYRSSWLDYLPSIYGDDEFLGRYLLIYESILNPIIWMVDNFDLYLSPEVAPSEWLRWMASWFDLLIIPDLPIERQRAIMGQIGWLFLRRGTRGGLERLLELYFGVRPEIIEDRDEACHFVVRLPLSKSDNRIGREVAERLIASQKPAFASHTLEIT